jgi:4-hydroxy-tetrahydrodipicolinate reductase
MKIALFGYGKMGKMIAQIALERGHTIAAKIDVDTPSVDYSGMDVAMDFSSPDAAFENIKGCLEHGIPVISGTTGWLDSYEKAVAICKEHKGAFIYASNFSLGVNVFFELNTYLAGMMHSLPQYRAEIEEIHHTQKVDAPSGTAITLAEGIIGKSAYRAWALNGGEENKIPVYSKREGEVPGTHTITYRSEIDTIEIKHTAHSREGFALGAVVAAEWIQGKEGVFGMKDVLNLKQ